MLSRSRIAILGGALVALGPTARAEEAAAERPLVETLATVGTSPWPSAAWYSRAIVSAPKDLAHVAIAVAKPEAMWIDGKRGPAFDLIAVGPTVDEPKCVWSSGGRHAYAGTRNGKQYLVVDGVEAGPYEDVSVRSFRWDETGRHFACVVGVKGGSQVWIDGKLGPMFQEVWSDTLTFGPGGASLAYAAARDGRAVLVVDGAVKEAAGSHDRAAVQEIAVSSDGAHLAMLVETSGGQACLVDGAASRTYAATSNLEPVRGKGTFFFHAGERQDGRETHRWVVGGVELPAGAGIGMLFFSPDGAHHAYVLRELNKPAVVLLDGKALAVEGASLTDVVQSSLRFSPDGTRLAFTAMAEGRRVVVDGKASPPIAGTVVDSLLFSPDSKHLAYRAVQDSLPGAWQVGTIYVDGVARGTATGRWDWPHAFSPDSAAFAYVTFSRDKGLHRIQVLPVAGGGPRSTPTPLDGELWPELTFPDAGSVRYLGVIGTDLVRVDARW